MRQDLVRVVAEALASTALRANECDLSGGWLNRYYTLTVESRAQHDKRAEDIVDRVLGEGFSLERQSH